MATNQLFIYGSGCCCSTKAATVLVELVEGCSTATPDSFLMLTLSRQWRGRCCGALTGRSTLLRLTLRTSFSRCLVAQVIYPKDLAPICVLADILPGVKVLESGVGSGVLSMTMLRWGARLPVMNFVRFRTARANVASFLGEEALQRYHVKIGDSYEGIDLDDGPFDRVVLDLPEPWNNLHAERVLRPRYWLPTRRRLPRQPRHGNTKGRWLDTRTIEVLHRGWYIDGNQYVLIIAWLPTPGS